jgi:hypothetical protein
VVDRIQANDDPVVPHVSFTWQEELGGSDPTSAARSSFGNAKPIIVSSRENAR